MGSTKRTLADPTVTRLKISIVFFRRASTRERGRLQKSRAMP
ncbi:MAG: hypothetical protein O7D27_01125 [Alphaproteobacteria bacterium]|nr:hypothetical protein [Alphaproteobacteria bacterium]MCZ6496484.1 hypothetical protein [Alphaproteobacteria bacterium]MCZ6740739.1 hypothetical protein [Alphaproteobacteria bacterium]MCZ6813161.1 hypothetical protein [Alphaproteobacteria bacterium]